jgi:hypothetical protein
VDGGLGSDVADSGVSMIDQWPDTAERDDGMDGEDYHTREVYANFGPAIRHARVLEHGVVNLLTIAKIFPDPTATRECSSRSWSSISLRSSESLSKK